jgi:hypothetical protein
MTIWRLKLFRELRAFLLRKHLATQLLSDLHRKRGGHSPYPPGTLPKTELPLALTILCIRRRRNAAKKGEAYGFVCSS